MYDIIIIGGGAIGCSIARQLSKYDAKIALLEKNTEVCQETTKANSAIVHGGYDNKPGTLKAKLNVRGNEMYPKLAEELNFTFKQLGSLVLAFDDDDINVLKDLYNRGIKNKVKGLEIINGDRARELEPFISKDVIAALHCSSAGIIDPFNYTYAMIENAIENGVELFTENEVLDLKNKENHLEIKTSKNTFKSKYLINAAGLNSDLIANLSGDYDFKIQPTKGVYRLLAKDKHNELSSIVFQTPSNLGKGVLVTPTYDGNTMIGPTSERIDTKDYIDNEEYSLEILDNLGKKSVPNININKSIRVFTGIRAKPDTGDFMIYKSNNLKNLLHVGGIESPGLASAPAIAEYVNELIVNMGFNNSLNEKYNPIRKKEVRISKLNDSDRKKHIKINPDYGIKICRCEDVSKGEIIDAINRPGGAVTKDGIKRRVRAGMGFCQGNHCGPKVENILAKELNIDKSKIKKEVSGSEKVNEYLANK